MASEKGAPDFTGLYDGYASAEKYVAPEEDKKLVAKLNDWRKKSEEHRLPWERSAELNRHYLRGDQLLARNKLTGDILRLSADDSRRLRSQNNILRPTARSLVGKLSRLIPTYTVTPATSDFEEQHGARCATAILQYVRQKLDLDKIYGEICEYLPWAGNGFAHLSWDKLAGRKIGYCGVCNYFSYDEKLLDQPCPQCSMQRQQEEQIRMQNAQMAQEDMQMSAAMGMPPPEPPPEPPAFGPLPQDQERPTLVEAYEGDVRVAIRDPRDVFIPPGCLDIRMARRVCVRELVEVAEARRRYPRFAAFISAESSFDQSYRARNMGSSFDQLNLGSDLDDHCYIYEYHEMPTEAYRKGRVIIVINDILVEESESPYHKLDRVPIYHFGFDKINGEFYCDAFITQAWHRQRELNLLETQLREHVEQVLRPKLMNPQGSRISAEEFHAASDQVITYVPQAGKPDWITPPALPNGIWDRKQDLMQDVRMTAAITESEQGVSQADPNGRALAIINAESDQQVGPIMHRNNSEWRELHRGLIALYQCYAHPDRIASIAGPDSAVVVEFESLNLLQPGWDIRMDQEDSLSRNPSVRLQQAMELANIGLFLDPMTGQFDKKAFARFAKLPLPEAGYDQEATERAAASQIPYMIQKGVMFQPRTFDIPQIFVEELGAWLRGPGRRADPMLSQQVEQIWQFYAQWAMTGQMGMAPGQQPQPGPGAPGQPSQPGSGRTAPGGSVGNPGGLGTDVASGSSTQVQQADAAGEGVASSYS